MKVKIISDSFDEEFEDKVNAFIKKVKVIDIKYQVTNNHVLSAMIQYEGL